MRAPISRRPTESADAVGVIVALLERFPEIATLVSHPQDGTLTLSFAVEGRLDRTAERETREAIAEHVRALLALTREVPVVLTLDVEGDEALSFVRLTRDAQSLTREELAMVVALLGERFPQTLVRSTTEDDGAAEEPEAMDELVEYALDALRDPASQRSLVGFREEKRVLVYFVKVRKKSTRARS